MRRAAPAHLAQRHFDGAKTCKIQCADKPLRPKGASERQFALSRHPQSLIVTVRILHVFRIFCSRFISSSLILLLHRRICNGTAPFLGEANNPFWSNHVAAWYRSALEAEQYCRKHDLSTTSLMRWARHLPSADDLCKRAEHLRNLPRRTPKRRHETGAVEATKTVSALSLRRADGHRSGGSSGVLGHACGGDELQRHGACRRCRGAWSITAFAAHPARSAGTIRQRNG